MLREMNIQIPEKIRNFSMSLKDEAVLEFNISTGEILWANNYFLHKLNIEISQISKMSLFNISPLEFHDHLRDEMAEILQNKNKYFLLWPLKKAGLNLSWFYAKSFKIVGSTAWIIFEYMGDTANSGGGFVIMKTLSTVLDNQSDIYSRIKSMEMNFGNMNSKPESSEYSNEMAETEILRLIKTDHLHDSKMESFESKVREMTKIAIEAIQNKANKEEKGLQMKVTVPISLVAAIMTAAQLILSHIFHR